MVENYDFTDLTLIKPVKKYAFVFVCQEGNLEIESLLLASSLKRFLKCEFELIAAVPQPTVVMGKPKEVTMNLLREMGVRIAYIHNELISKNLLHKLPKRILLITNKIYCLKIGTSADKLIFLDSDTLCCKQFYGDLRFSIPFNAVMVGMGGNKPYMGKWNKIYEAADVEIPLLRIRIEGSEKNQSSFSYAPPYFNAGFVGIKAELADELSDCWMKCYKDIVSKGVTKHHLYFTEQIAMALAVHKMKIPYEILDFNWLNSYFAHYIKPQTIKNNLKLNRLAKSLSIEHSEIKELIRDNASWQFLLGNSKYKINRIKNKVGSILKKAINPTSY